MPHQVPRTTHISNPARRHFMAIVAAGAGRLSMVALPAIAVGACQLIEEDQRHHCLARGTRILTPNGEVAVERLKVGDHVVTSDGELPIKWIGNRIVKRSCSTSWLPDVIPIRVSQSAIEDGIPHRDLLLSPEHSLLIDGGLIPVKYLVNGYSIAPDELSSRLTEIEYFTIELDRHEILYAEGAAAETFLYAGGTMAWDNLDEYHALYGTSQEPMTAYAPVHRYDGGRAELGGLMRLAVSRFVDVRDPIQIAHDRIASRAMEMDRAA